MNAKEAARRQGRIRDARRQGRIRDTLAGLLEIFETNLHQEMDPEQEAELIKLLALGEKWCRGEL